MEARCDGSTEEAMSGTWRNCDRPAGGSYHAPARLHGAHCGRTYLHKGPPVEARECMGTVVEKDGKRVCRECEMRRKRR
jgi:hypothetical protein